MTKPAPKKRRPFAHDDTYRRVSEAFGQLQRWWQAYVEDDGPPVLAVCSESIQCVRSANASTLIGLGWGIFIAMAELRDLPFLQARPQEIKQHLCGSAAASKKEVALALQHRMRLSPEVPTDNEHVMDAAAAALTCLDQADVLRAAIRAVL